MKIQTCIPGGLTDTASRLPGVGGARSVRVETLPGNLGARSATLETLAANLEALNFNLDGFTFDLAPPMLDLEPLNFDPDGLTFELSGQKACANLITFNHLRLNR